MKKKLMFLALAVVSLSSICFAQTPVVSQTITNSGGTFTIVGNVNNVNPNATLTIGSLITFVSSGGSGGVGTTYTYQVVLTPSTNPAGLLSAMSNAIGNAFNTANVRGPGNATFGSNSTEVSLMFVSQNVPFDFGLSAMLGVGALGAVRAARKRRKEQALIGA